MTCFKTGKENTVIAIRSVTLLNAPKAYVFQKHLYLIKYWLIISITFFQVFLKCQNGSFIFDDSNKK